MNNEVATAEQRPDYRPGGVTGKGWRPGQSGNPNGRRPGPGPPMAISPRTLRELARGYTRECVETLASIMQSAPRPADRIEAASILLSRGWGLPTQPIAAEGEIMIPVSEIQRAAEWVQTKLLAYSSREEFPAPSPPALPPAHVTLDAKLARLFDDGPDNGGPAS
jgi:hypothetical protein